jgi:hypothetical protein
MDTAGNLVITNVPSAGQVLKATNGTAASWQTDATGTVTSVGMSVPASFLSVSGSPVLTTGTLAVSLTSQTANTVFAAPNGSAGTPTFRALTVNDLPAGGFWGGDAFNALPSNGTTLNITVVSGKRYYVTVQVYGKRVGGNVVADIFFDLSLGATTTWGSITQVARQNHQLASGELYVFSGWAIVTTTATTLTTVLRTDSSVLTGTLTCTNMGVTAMRIN